MQFPLPYFVLWQNKLSEEFGLFSSLSQKLLLYFPRQYVISILQVFWNFTLCSLDQSVEDSGAHLWQVFTPGAADSRYTGHPFQVKANCVLCIASRGIKKNALMISIVTYHLVASDSRSY